MLKFVLSAGVVIRGLSLRVRGARHAATASSSLFSSWYDKLFAFMPRNELKAYFCALSLQLEGLLQGAVSVSHSF
jgi:hypothetical protein